MSNQQPSDGRRTSVDSTIPPFALDLDARGWRLYSSMPGADAAAQRLTAAAERAYGAVHAALARGASVAEAAEEAYAILDAAMTADRSFGASDTEPDGVAQELIAQWIADRLQVRVGEENAPVLWRLWNGVEPAPRPAQGCEGPRGPQGPRR